MYGDRPCSVYRLYDAAGVLLYIGSSRNPDARIAAHRKGTSMYGGDEIRDRLAQHTVVHYATQDQAQQVERGSIYHERPLFNRMHNLKRFLRMDGVYYPVDYAVWLTGPAGQIMRRMAEWGVMWDQLSRATGVTHVQLGHIPNRRIERVKPHELDAIYRFLDLVVEEVAA